MISQMEFVRMVDVQSETIDRYLRDKGLQVEKRQCLYLREYTRKEVERNILSNPFKRFEDMNFMRKARDIEYIEVNRHIMKRLEENEFQ